MSKFDLRYFHEIKEKLSNNTKVLFKCPTCFEVTERRYINCIGKTKCAKCYTKNKKINDKVIPFEEAKKTLTKGSHRKVLWRCPNCEKTKELLFKQAVKTKLCKACNNIKRPKPDFSGKNTPFYGKKHSKEMD